VLLSHGALAAHVRHWDHWVREMLANRAHPPPARAHPLRTAASAHPCARFAHHLRIGCARSGRRVGGSRRVRKATVRTPFAERAHPVRTHRYGWTAVGARTLGSRGV